jgi:hypothetical protein
VRSRNALTIATSNFSGHFPLEEVECEPTLDFSFVLTEEVEIAAENVERRAARSANIVVSRYPLIPIHFLLS